MCTAMLRHYRALAFAAAAATIVGCAKNPVTGQRQLALISESQEIAMGQQAAQEVEASIGLVKNAALQDYVRRVGSRLAAGSERPDIPWRFGVIDDPTPNAFALPGGPIYITRGLLSLMDSEAELASVLGHEIGHITARHSVSQISKAQLAQLGLGVGMILAPQLQQFGGALESGLSLLFLKYGRDAERQADDLGFKYALNGRYDVREMADVFASLERAGGEQKSALPSWLSTHPSPGERVKRVEERIAALPAPPSGANVGRAEFMGRIEGMVYGNNPRQGFFRDGVFLHPDLRFRLDFPQGWKTQNLPQAVVAASPQQDAVIQLTLSQGSPDQAARQFFAQQGVQPGQASRESINGMPAVSGYFQAQTQQGTIAGLATFVQHGSQTYQILSYSPAQAFRGYDPVFRRVAGSFATLTDPAALAVQPNRIDVVRLARAMSLTTFARTFPSVVDLQELALINQVTDANATIAAGTQLKRVVSR